MTQKPGHLIRTEIVISLVLRYGVILCGLVIALGLLIRGIHEAPGVVSSGDLIAELMRGGILPGFSPLHEWGGFVTGFGAWDSDSIMAAGILMLILLPVARVGMTVLLFLLEKDWPFFFITSLVFLILLSSLLMGKSI